MPSTVLELSVYGLNPLKFNPFNYYTLSHRTNLSFLISDIQTLWRFGPECHKFKNGRLGLYGAEYS